MIDGGGGDGGDGGDGCYCCYWDWPGLLSSFDRNRFLVFYIRIKIYFKISKYSFDQHNI